MPSLVGHTLGAYRIVEPLGRGGMNTVYRARHVESGDEVALKTVNAPRESVVQCIRREIRALSQVRHPSVVRIVDDGVLDGVPWYAMELVEGPTLTEACRRGTATTLGGDLGGTATESPAAMGGRGPDGAGQRIEAPAPLDLPRMLTLARAICPGLAYLHGEGLVHCDLKPDNIVLRADDDPVLVDFGLASLRRSTTNREALEVRADIYGTAAYVAPEVIRCEPVDARADLYALGCILYEMITGAGPFAAFTTAAVLRGHLEVTPRPPSELVAEVPPALDALVMRLLEKEPRHRLGHADHVARILEDLGAVSPSRPMPRPRDYLYRPRFIGRRTALDDLTGELRRAREGSGSLTLVAGESGLGKTRLVNELGARAARDGFTVLDGECQPDGDGPLSPFRKLLQRLADRCRMRGPEETLALFGAGARVLSPYEPSLADLPGLEAIPPLEPLPRDAARSRAFRAMGDTLRAAAAEAPLLLILDDLQWADPLTLALLSYLTREIVDSSALLIVGTYRREERHEALIKLAEQPQARLVELESLDDDEVHVMVSDMLADLDPGSLGEFVARQAEGNPFFVAEYLRAALETGLLHRDAQHRWRLAREHAGSAAQELGPALPLPGPLRDLVERRLGHLTPPARSLVGDASVIGRESTIEALIEMRDTAPEAVRDSLTELLQRQIIEDTPSGGVRFAHDKLREVVYDGLDEEARRDAHRRAAFGLAAQAGGEPPYEALAHHYLRAGMAPEAVEALHHASSRALKQGAFRRADDGYREALALAADGDERRADWEFGRGEALMGLGEAARGQAHLLRCLELSGHSAAEGSAAVAVGLAGQVSRQLGHRLLPRAAVERGEDRTALLRGARACQRLVETYWFENDLPRMVHAGVRALNLAERAGPSPDLACAYATMCLTAGSLPIHPLAEHYATLAQRTAGAVEDPSAEVYMSFLVSVYRVGSGKWSQVESDLQDVVRISRRIGDVRFHGEGLTVLGMSRLYQGAFQSAAEHFREVRDLGRRYDNLQHRAWGALGGAEALFRIGDLDGAEALLEDAATLLASTETQSIETLRLHGLRASLSLERGDLVGAQASARRAERHIAKLTVPTAHYLLEGYAGVAAAHLATLTAALEAGRSGGTERRAAQKAVNAARMFGAIFPIGKPRAESLRAALASLSGEPGAARRRFERSIRAASALGMGHEPELTRAMERLAARRVSSRA